MKKIYLLVVILLSGNLMAQEVQTLYPSKDVSLGYHDNYNTEYNNYDYAFQFAAYTMNGYAGGVNSNRALIAFDFTGIPVNTVIDSAVLSFFAFDDYSVAPLNQGHGGNNTSYLRKVTNSWIEDVVSWSTQPNTTTEHEVILQQSTDPHQNYFLDVTASVQYFVTNPSLNFGYKFGLLDESIGNNMSFYSKDGTDSTLMPVLKVYYRDASTNKIEVTEAKNPVNLFPNPVNDILKINAENEIKSLTVFDVNGKKVEIEIISNKNNEINVSKLNSGYYFIEVETIDGKSRNKFLKM